MYKRLSCNRETTQCCLLVNVLSTAALLYYKSCLKEIILKSPSDHQMWVLFNRPDDFILWI